MDGLKFDRFSQAWDEIVGRTKIGRLCRFAGYTPTWFRLVAREGRRLTHAENVRLCAAIDQHIEEMRAVRRALRVMPKHLPERSQRAPR